MLLVASVFGVFAARDWLREGREERVAAQQLRSTAALRAQEAAAMAAIASESPRPLTEAVATVVQLLRRDGPALGLTFSYLAIGDQVGVGLGPNSLTGYSVRLAEGDRAAVVYVTVAGQYRDEASLRDFLHRLVANHASISHIELSGQEIKRLTLAIHGVQ